MRWVMGRLLQMGVVLAVLSVLLFRLLLATPGNAAELMAATNPSVAPQDVTRLAALRGWDQPWFVQYWRWLVGYQDALLPPVQDGPQDVDQEAGHPWTVDLSTTVKDGDGGSVRLHPLTPTLRVDALRVSGGPDTATTTRVTLVAVDGDGLETAVHLRFRSGGPTPRTRLLSTQVAKVHEPFTLQLAQLAEEGAGVNSFHLVRGDGEITHGHYVHTFKQPGQSVVAIRVEFQDGQQEITCFTVEHGLIPDPRGFHRGVLLGNLGYSTAYKQPVAHLLEGRVANTLWLMLPALLLSLLVAVPLGILAATRPRSWLDRLVRSAGLVGISTPAFWLGMILILVFAVNLRWFPAGGLETPGEKTWADRTWHLVLPVTVLVMVSAGRWLRYVRNALLEVIHQDYIRTARAKGLSARQTLWKHALPNALIPLVTVVALSLPSLFSGALLTETVFSWPGVGRLIHDSVMSSDHHVAMVTLLISAALVMIGNLVADVAYRALDPRVGTQG